MGKIHLIVMLLGLLTGTSLNSCTVGINRTNENAVVKNYNLDYFDRIELNGGYKVQLIQGEKPALSVTTSEENQEKFKVWVNNRTLHVTPRSKVVTTDGIKLDITIDQLNNINIEGGVCLTTMGYIDIENLNIEVEGGAHIKMKLTAKKIKAKAEGGVNMKFEGVTDEFIASTEGAGNIDADNLKSRRVRCHVAGVGNASVYATENLDACVEGVGKISYRGNPIISKQIDGIGLVYKK